MPSKLRRNSVEKGLQISESLLKVFFDQFLMSSLVEELSHKVAFRWPIVSIHVTKLLLEAIDEFNERFSWFDDADVKIIESLLTSLGQFVR